MTAILDAINGCFELVAGLMVLLHCRTLCHDKEVKGVNVFATVFFTLWGFWNLLYYPALEQWLSLAGGCLIVIANAVWLTLMIHYRRHPGGSLRNARTDALTP